MSGWAALMASTIMDTSDSSKVPGCPRIMSQWPCSVPAMGRPGNASVAFAAARSGTPSPHPNKKFRNPCSADISNTSGQILPFPCRVGTGRPTQCAPTTTPHPIRQHRVEAVDLLDQPRSAMSSQHVVGIDERYGQPGPVLHRLADSVEEGLIGEAGQADIQEGPLIGPGLDERLPRASQEPLERQQLTKPGLEVVLGLPARPWSSACRGRRSGCPSPGRLRSGSSRTSSAAPRMLSMVARTSPIVVPVPVPTLKKTSKPSPGAVARIAFAVSVTKMRSRCGQRLPSSIGWPACMAAMMAGSTLESVPGGHRC